MSEDVTFNGESLPDDKCSGSADWVAEIRDPRVTERWEGGNKQRRNVRYRKNSSRVSWRVRSHIVERRFQEFEDKGIIERRSA